MKNIFITFFLFTCICATAQNVGIGTTLPAAKLQINSKATFGSPTLKLYDSSASSAATIEFQNASGNNYWQLGGLLHDTDPTKSFFHYYTNSSPFLFSIRGDGNVGIGASDPQHRLHLYNDAGSQTTYAKFSNPTTGILANDGLDVGISGFGNAFIYNWEVNKSLFLGTAGINRLSISELGRVGIGIDNATEILEIASGNFKMTNTDKGILLNTANRPLITRAWDAFTSGPYAGVGRWGLFMEPNRITMGFPGAGGSGFTISGYDVNSSIIKNVVDVSIDGSTNGVVNIDGNLTVNSNGTIRSVALAGTGTRTVKAASNGVLTAAVQTSYVNVPASSFIKQDGSTTSYINYSGGGDYAVTFSNGATDVATAPLNLPNGATLVNMRIYFVDNSANDLDINFQTSSTAGSGTTTVASYTTAGVSAAIQVVTVPIVTVINNNTTFYRLSIGPDVGDTWQLGFLRVKGVVFEIQQ